MRRDILIGILLAIAALPAGIALMALPLLFDHLSKPMLFFCFFGGIALTLVFIAAAVIIALRENGNAQRARRAPIAMVSGLAAFGLVATSYSAWLFWPTTSHKIKEAQKIAESPRQPLTNAVTASAKKTAARHKRPKAPEELSLGERTEFQPKEISTSTNSIGPPLPAATPAPIGETHHSIAGMRFSASTPITIGSGTSTRIRLKISIGITGDKPETTVEFYDLVSGWKILTAETTCRGDRKSVEQNALYDLDPDTDAVQYVEFLCPRPVTAGEVGDLNLTLRQTEKGKKPGLFGYNFDTPPFR